MSFYCNLILMLHALHRCVCDVLRATISDLWASLIIWPAGYGHRGLCKTRTTVNSHFRLHYTYLTNQDILIDKIIITPYRYIISEYWDVCSIYFVRALWSVFSYNRFTHNPLFRYPARHTIKLDTLYKA
jgi:hypothetical protein